MRIQQEISGHSNEFISLCKEHCVGKLYAFGSSTRSDFNDESDIDLIVEIDSNDPLQKGEYLLSLWDKFETFFHRKVDLLTSNTIKNPYLKKNIEKSKVLIYDGERSQISI